MRIPNWLLGRDTRDLTLARGVRTAVWWVAWAQLALGVFVFVLALRPRTALDPGPPVSVESYLGYLLTAVTPFIGWALLTALISVHDLFAGAEDDADMDTAAIEAEKTSAVEGA
jgi:hypothetical protein